MDFSFCTFFDNSSNEVHDYAGAADVGLGDESPYGGDFYVGFSEGVYEVLEFGVDAESCGSVLGEGDGAEELIVF